MSLDLTACDREPIHIPGAIQPHGVLLAVDPERGTIAAVAGDVSMLGWDRPSVAALEALLGGALPAQLEGQPLFLGTFRASEGDVDVVAHRSGGFALFEIEPVREAPLSSPAALAAAQALSARLEAAHDVNEACRHAAESVRALTGYDRVMVYRFLADGSGAVVAEARGAALDPLLNHHFPASDIPRQARQLYLRNLVRVIPDIAYAPALLMALEPVAAPLDMSDCFLRSVSPVHIKYLQNMGVGASASISVVAGGELWGLIACHHLSPRHLGYVQREVAKHLGQLLGQHVAMRERSLLHSEALRLAQKREDFVATLPGAGSTRDATMRHAGELMRVVPSDGCALLSDGALTLAGVTPDEAETAALFAALDDKAEDGLFATHSLSIEHPPAAGYRAAASGALYCRVLRDPYFALLWFRAEQVETINWAGNPHKPVDEQAGALTPRASFDLWRETVHGQARRWSPAEIESADKLRSQLTALLQQEEMHALNRQLRRTLEEKEDLIGQKDLLMREVNHRVQNSLQLVNSMLYLQQREMEGEEVRAHFERARQRLTAVAMVHRRLWRTDKIGDVRLESFLAELADELIKIWGPEWARHIRVEAPPLTLSTDRGILLGLVVTELLTNAVKYAYDGAAGPLAVEAREDGRGTLRIMVADRGKGMTGNDEGKGFGSRLIDTLVRQLGGRIEVTDNAPGTRATLTVPLDA